MSHLDKLRSRARSIRGTENDLAADDGQHVAALNTIDEALQKAIQEQHNAIAERIEVAKQGGTPDLAREEAASRKVENLRSELEHAKASTQPIPQDEIGRQQTNNTSPNIHSRRSAAKADRELLKQLATTQTQTIPERQGFDRARWKRFIEALEKQIQEAGSSDESQELLKRFKNPEYILSSAASLKTFAENPRNKGHVDTMAALADKAKALRTTYESADVAQQQAWQAELNTFAENKSNRVIENNPLAALAALSQAPQYAEAIDAVQKASLPNVTIPDAAVPPGLSQRTWNSVMWGAATVSTLATAWGFSDTVKGGLLEYPDTYAAIDQTMRSIGEIPLTNSTPTVLTITAGLGIALSFLVSVGIKSGRDKLARTSFERKTGIVRAMAHNPMAALLFSSMVALSGAGAIKGVVTNFAKSEQTEQFAGTALKEIGPVVERATQTYENAQAFDTDFDRYLYLLVKEEGEPLSSEELTEKQKLVGKGWNFPPVAKQAVGPKAATKAWAIDGRTLATEEKYTLTAQKLKEAVMRTIPQDQLPLRGYATRLVKQVELTTISERVKRQLETLKSNLETSAANKYTSAILMFFGLLNADPQTAQDTLTYAKKDLDLIPAEAQKLKGHIGHIGAAYSNILKVIQGGGSELNVVFPNLPAADPKTLQEIEEAFQKIKNLLPERPASIWIPESDWKSAMEFLGAEDTPEGRYAVLGIGIALYGFIDLVLALLYLRSSRKKKEYLDIEVPKKYEELESMEQKIVVGMLSKLEALRPAIQSTLGITPAHIDAEYLKAMLRKKARNEVAALAEFASWEKEFPLGSIEYLSHVNEKRNDLLPEYGTWLRNFAQTTDDSLMPPFELVKDAYPEYARAAEFIAQATDPSASQEKLSEAFNKLRSDAERDGTARDTQHIEQSLRMIIAEEAARRSFHVENKSESQSALVNQLYTGVVFPLKDDTLHEIVTLLGQNAALLQLQYATEQQRFRRHTTRRLFDAVHPSIKKAHAAWFTSDGDIAPPEDVVADFLRKAENPESPEYALLTQTKARISNDVGGHDGEQADFDQERALEQLNAVRTAIAPFVEQSLAKNETLKAYAPEVCYGVDPETGRPTVLVALYDPNNNGARVALAAYPGRVPNMREKDSAQTTNMLRDWYELTVENELVMKLHARELAALREKSAQEHAFSDTVNIKTIDVASFPFSALVQYTIDDQRLRLLEERTAQDLLYNPITEREMKMLRFGDMIAIRGYRRFEPDVIRTIFSEVQNAAQQNANIEISYKMENRTLVAQNTVTGTEMSVPLIFYRDTRSLLDKVTQDGEA